MAAKATICIPTYGKKVRNQLIVARTLESISKLNNEDLAGIRVILFNTTHPYDEHTGFRINRLIEKYKHFFDIAQITSLDLDYLNSFLASKKLNLLAPHISFKGYSNMRNAMLVVSNILDSKTVIMIDDDEIITDKGFIRTALEFIAEKGKKKIIYGKTGYYLYENGPYLIQQSPKTRKLWLKETYINQTLEKYITSKARLSKTTIAFGGILVLHNRLYRKIPFDPYIPRGEDTDYVINARQFNFNFVFDNHLKILHKPPKKHIKYYEKLRQDIFRFIYTREKLKYFNRIDIKSLEPYPAAFLKDDIEYRAVATAVRYATRSLKNNRQNDFKEYFNNVKIAFTDAKINAMANAPKYFEFQKNWENLMRSISKFKSLKRHFNRF